MDAALDREARGARNQSLFRHVNERVLEINHAFSMVLPLGEWVCECADQSCAERIYLSKDEYEAIRAHPMRFCIAPGDAHVVEEIEIVVERTDAYWVVEKQGRAGEIAAEIDPRRAS